MSERIQALHALRAFEVASRYGSFTRAAEELALTQGAVSHPVSYTHLTLPTIYSV